MEEALTDPAGWLATLAAYRIEIVALAVPEAVSQLGGVDRYLWLAKEGRARYVGWDNHDACAAALPAVLADSRPGARPTKSTVQRRGRTANPLVAGLPRTMCMSIPRVAACSARC
ncbi:zeta toxin family protein [Streptomyces kaempferi]